LTPRLILPLPPVPPREHYQTEESYQAMLGRYAEAKAIHDRSLKEQDAMLMVEIGLFLIVLIAFLGLVGYGLDGVRGAIGAPVGFAVLIGGLMSLQQAIAKRL